MEKYFYCLDIGGTDIKAGIVDEKYNILFTEQISSSIIKSNESLKSSVLKIIGLLESKSSLKIANASGLGVGLPGLVNSNTGTIEYLPNLKVSKYNIVENLSSELKIPIKIANDAELALLAEHTLGAGAGLDNFALVTLGTGVGLGLMINGKNLRSISPFSSEYGHNLFDSSGNDIESLVSTKALTNQIKEAMKNNPSSKMWSTYNLDTANGKTLFDFMNLDDSAKHIFDNYISNLGRVLVNLYNVFTPEVMVIGGGISKQGEKLTKPLEEFVNKNIFLKNIGMRAKIVPAKFLNEAGLLGARCLFD